MAIPRRWILAAAAAATLALLLPLAPAQAAYPEKAVTIVVPFPPGGRTDLMARLLAQHLGKQLGQAAVVVNKPGAGGVLGAKEVAAAAPDGYTLGVFSTAVVTAQYTVPTPTDLKDYALVAVVNVDPMAIAVKADAQWKTLKELVAYGKQNPAKLRIGMIPGASAQIFAASFAHAAGVQVTNVPFKGDSDGAAALAGGHIDVHVAVPVSYKALPEAKKVRVLARAAAARSPMYKDVATFRENGVDLVIGAFHGVYVPKKTPQAVIDKLADAIEQTMKSKEVRTAMDNAGAGVVFVRGEEAKAFLAKQDATYRGIIEKLGLRVAPAK